MLHDWMEVAGDDWVSLSETHLKSFCSVSNTLKVDHLGENDVGSPPYGRIIHSPSSLDIVRRVDKMQQL